MDMLLLWICWFCRGFTDPHLLPPFEMLSSSMLCILINKLSTSLPRWILFNWTFVHMSTWAMLDEQCSRWAELLDANKTCNRCHQLSSTCACGATCDYGISLNCQPQNCQLVANPEVGISEYKYWIINRISQLQLKHAQGSTFNQWNLEKMEAAGSELSWDVYNKAGQKSNSWVAYVLHLSLNLE